MLLSTFKLSTVVTGLILLCIAGSSVPARADSRIPNPSTPVFRPAVAVATGGGYSIRAAAFSEVRPCDNSVSKYYPDSPTGTGSGSDADITQAKQKAFWNALYNDAKSQFSCEECDEGGECPKKEGSASSEGAVMTNPKRDCNFDDASGEWVCDGEITFQVAGSPKPWAEAGCQKCAKVKKTASIGQVR